MSLVWPPQSPFFSKFSLVELARNNSSRWGLLCDESGGHGPATFGGSLGENSEQQRSEGFTCQIAGTNDAGLDEAGFLKSLMAATEKDIEDSGAHVTRQESALSSGFVIEYAVSDIYGRIEVSGKRVGHYYYNLTARIEERRK